MCILYFQKPILFKFNRTFPNSSGLTQGSRRLGSTAALRSKAMPRVLLEWADALYRHEYVLQRPREDMAVPRVGHFNSWKSSLIWLKIRVGVVGHIMYIALPVPLPVQVDVLLDGGSEGRRLLEDLDVALAMVQIKLFLGGKDLLPDHVASAVRYDSEKRLRPLLYVDEDFAEATEARLSYFKSLKFRGVDEKGETREVSIADWEKYPNQKVGGYFVEPGLFADMSEGEGKRLMRDEWANWAVIADHRPRSIGWHKERGMRGAKYVDVGRWLSIEAGVNAKG